MINTGSAALDKAMIKTGLVNHSVSNELQVCIEITSRTDKYAFGALLRQSKLLNVPYCIYQAILSRSDEQTMQLHFISMPNKEPLLWLLMCEGSLVKQAFCKHNRNYKQVCQRVVNNLLSTAQLKGSSAA